MALIRCAECKAKISDKASSCPKCGAPIEISNKKRKKRTGCGCLIILLILFGFIMLMIPTDHRNKSKPATTSKQSSIITKKETASIPDYKIVDQEKYDAPVKTQVVFHAVVSGTISELGLKALLNKLYNDASAIRGFTYHDGKPTHIFIYLYSSHEHFKSGSGQWIAMLSKIGIDSQTDIEIKSKAVAQIDSKPEVKDGLSENKRKEIFKALILAEEQADNEAQKLYPLLDHTQPGYTQSKARAQLMKQADAVNSLIKKAQSDIAILYNITEDKLDDIAMEGINKNWPMR